jgi:hypothetical protein
MALQIMNILSKALDMTHGVSFWFLLMAFICQVQGRNLILDIWGFKFWWRRILVY